MLRTMVCVLSLTLLQGLGACSEDVGAGAGGDFSVDPGRCLSAPDLSDLEVGNPAIEVLGAAVSCTHVAWLAPIESDTGLSAPQVHVHDIANGFTFRTTTPDSDRVGKSSTQRWTPVLHGFWLAYLQDGKVMIENLRDFERAEFPAQFSLAHSLDIHYPWVVWEENVDFGRTAIMAGHLEDGSTIQVTPSNATATDPSVDAGRVLYTLWPEDLDGPWPALEGPSRVEVFTLGVDEVGQPIHPGEESTVAGTLYDDLVAYVLLGEEETYIVARSLDSGTEIGAVSGGGISTESRPEAGASVVTWLKGGGPTESYLAWWPHLSQVDEILLDKTGTMLSVGEHVLVTDTGSKSALNVELLYPREQEDPLEP